VTQPRSDHVHRLSGQQQRRGAYVPKIVQSNAWQRGSRVQRIVLIDQLRQQL
jgi:hypothetical protein